MKTYVMSEGPTRLDMVGQKLPSYLRELSEEISQGLAYRLHRYATQRMVETGFGQMIASWDVEVYTLNGDEKPVHRSYCVRFVNKVKGYIEVIGILTCKGWPTSDHGFYIGQDH